MWNKKRKRKNKMVLTLFICFLVLLTVAIVRETIIHELSKRRTGISFKESLDLADLPVITMYNNGKKLNFLLDTGSNISHIDSSIDNLDCELIEKECLDITTVGGELKGGEKWLRIPLTYKKQNFSEDFMALELHDTFAQIKKETGVQIHGILGNSFFIKYKYMLDFDEMVAYIK